MLALQDCSLDQVVWTYYYDFVKCSGEVYSPAAVGFVGLGNMGAPMATNLGQCLQPQPFHQCRCTQQYASAR